MLVKEILPPTECPACGGEVEYRNDLLYCTNKQCSAQILKRAEHFCKVMKLKGFGPKTLEKLGIDTLSDMFVLTEKRILTRLGSEKLASKLISEIYTKLNGESLDLGQFLSAMNIPLFGNTAGAKLSKVVSELEQIDEKTCKQAGLGDKVTQNLLDWLDNESSDFDFIDLKFSQIKSQVETAPVEHLADVCITGKLNDFKNRNDAAAYLESKGFVVKNSVTKTVSFLICEDESKRSSSSYKKAEAAGIKIGSINELIEIFLEE